MLSPGIIEHLTARFIKYFTQCSESAEDWWIHYSFILGVMGRYDLRPHRVHQTTTQLLGADRISNAPPWFNVVGSITPAQALVRTQPLPHERRKAPPKTKKVSKLFQPQKISYEEDSLRKKFFKDHPWELARPRMIIEGDGKDSQKTDWSHTQQERKALSGERWAISINHHSRY